MPELKRSLGFWDGLAMVVGIMVGTGIFRTPGLVAQQLGRPWLTFVAWAAGGAIAFLGALIFAELATRHPNAGGKYVYAREAFGPGAGFVVGWIEGLAYAVATAAIGVVSGEYAGRLIGVGGDTRWLGGAMVVVFTGINLLGVASGRWVQNVATAAKVAALGGVVVVALARGDGSGWHSALPTAPAGAAVWGALAIAFQSVIWTYYGYLDAGKIAEEVVEPSRTLPKVFLVGIGVAAGLYLLLNAAFLQVLPIDRIAASNLVPGDVVAALFAVGGDAADRRLEYRPGRDRQLRAAARPRDQPGARHRQLGGRGAAAATLPHAARPVPGAAVSARPGAVPAGVRGAVRGDGGRRLEGGGGGGGGGGRDLRGGTGADGGGVRRGVLG